MMRGRWIVAGVPLLIAAMLIHGLAATPVLGESYRALHPALAIGDAE